MNISNFISKTIHDYIVHAYRKTPEYKVEQFLYLMQPPVFYRSGPDSAALLDWRRLSRQHTSQASINAFDMKVIKDYSLIFDETKEIIPDFNVGNIQSLSASKAFSTHKTNAKYDDVADWGANMYHDKNLSGRDASDFERNIRYTEKLEGFRDTRPVQIEHLGWLKRNIGIQTGGSHHLAMIIHQINHQDMEYKREALLTKVNINEEALTAFTDNYTAILTTSKITGKSDNEMKYSLQELFSSHYATCLPIHQLYEEAWLHLIVIENKSLDEEKQKILNYLLASSKKYGLHIELDKAMRNTLSLCTTRPPLKKDCLPWAS